jgi:DNA-binding NarL/FixJ family response regulator
MNDLDRFAVLETLTKREREVLRQIASGLTNRQIAERLCLSPKTVERHQNNIFEKLGVANRTQAALLLVHGCYLRGEEPPILHTQQPKSLAGGSLDGEENN